MKNPCVNPTVIRRMFSSPRLFISVQGCVEYFPVTQKYYTFLKYGSQAVYSLPARKARKFGSISGQNTVHNTGQSSTMIASGC